MHVRQQEERDQLPNVWSEARSSVQRERALGRCVCCCRDYQHVGKPSQCETDASQRPLSISCRGQRGPAGFVAEGSSVHPRGLRTNHGSKQKVLRTLPPGEPELELVHCGDAEPERCCRVVGLWWNARDCGVEPALGPTLCGVPQPRAKRTCGEAPKGGHERGANCLILQRAQPLRWASTLNSG